MRALKDAPAMTATVITVDPTELQNGDVVLRLSEHEESGCHCDVRVTVMRAEPKGT